jgi:hypothetical protein
MERMISKLKISEVKSVYAELKKVAIAYYEKGQYVDSWLAVRDAVDVIQQFSWEYCDDELEQLLQQLSAQWLPDYAKEYKGNDNRVVVVDDWCTSYVLVLQYIDALVAAGKEILYITSKDIDASSYKNIIPTIKDYPKLQYHVLPAGKQIIDAWTQDVYARILAFCPSKVVAHIGCVSPFLPTLYRLPDGLNIYRSNLDDQVFWLGKKAIDYCLEFRPFGVAVSRDRRGLSEEQQLYVPFYPIKDGNPFEGFPELPEGSVTIFSGGDFYKTLDPDYSYWNLVKRVLQDNPQAIFLYATKNVMGKTKDFLDAFVRDNHLEQQFKYIGFRSDISEVFAHADIFMGTCPVCGSLTSQLAAINHKPILQYYLPDTYDDETEQAVCYNAPGLQISFFDQDAFVAEASRLINDADYRKQKGEEKYAATLKPEQFNQIFIDAITTNHAPCPRKYVDYAEIFARWWWLEEMGFKDNLSYLYNMLKMRGLQYKVFSIWFKFQYRRYFETKLFSWKWYRYKLGV